MSRHQARRKQIADLDVMEIEGSEDGPTIVLLHGYGANMNDLVPLTEFIEAPEGTRWIFPNAHLNVPVGGFEGRAWFPLSIDELERSMSEHQPVDLTTMVRPGMTEARSLVMDLLDSIEVTPEKLLIGGFSQGAMLATETMLHLPTAPAGLAVLSGTLMNANDWKTRAARFPGFAFFQSHGSEDPLLSFATAQALERLFLDSGWKGQLARFRGGHDIPMPIIQQLGGYVRRRLA